MTAPTDGLVPFLGALQLTDSFFPSGLYTLSHGLESFHEAGRLTRDALPALLADYLEHGVGPADGVALACAHRAVETADLELAARADRRLTASKLAREAREASLRTGHQLLELAPSVFGGAALAEYHRRVRRGDAPGNHAVALGLTCATLGVARAAAVAAELHAFAVSCVAAAVRLAVIDFRMAQDILRHLAPLTARVAVEACDREVWEIGGCLPAAEIMMMRHERAEVRLFMS